MAARYDNVEKAMGIEAYASPDAPGFAAVSKARYSDFVVHEVDVDGNVSRLESLENNLVDAEEAAQEEAKKKEMREMLKLLTIEAPRRPNRK